MRKYRQAVWVLMVVMSMVTNAVAMSENNSSLHSASVITQTVTAAEAVGRNNQRALRSTRAAHGVKVAVTLNSIPINNPLNP